MGCGASSDPKVAVADSTTNSRSGGVANNQNRNGFRQVEIKNNSNGYGTPSNGYMRQQNGDQYEKSKLRKLNLDKIDFLNFLFVFFFLKKHHWRS